MSRANSFGRSEVGTERDQNHERFAPARGHDSEHAQKREKEKKIARAVATPFGQLAFLAFLRGAKIHPVENEEDNQNKSHREQPWAPAMLQRPPEWHALQKSQEQGRPDRQKRAADVADEENK